MSNFVFKAVQLNAINYGYSLYEVIDSEHTVKIIRIRSHYGE